MICLDDHGNDDNEDKDGNDDGPGDDENLQGRDLHRWWFRPIPLQRMFHQSLSEWSAKSLSRKERGGFIQTTTFELQNENIIWLMHGHIWAIS